MQRSAACLQQQQCRHVMPWLRLCSSMTRRPTATMAMTQTTAAATLPLLTRSHSAAAQPRMYFAALAQSQRCFATTACLHDVPPPSTPSSSSSLRTAQTARPTLEVDTATEAPPHFPAKMSSAANSADDAAIGGGADAAAAKTARKGTISALTPEEAQEVQRGSVEAHLRALEHASPADDAEPAPTMSTSSNNKQSNNNKQRDSGGHADIIVPSSIPIARVVRKVWSYLWPAKAYKLRCLVAGSVLCVLLAKCLKVVVPFWFKTIVDSLAPAATTSTAVAAMGGPFGVGVFGCVVGYGLCRIVGSLAEELKTILFAPVGGHASTQLAMEMFDKLHRLDLHWHLSRETGKLSKDLDRGSRAFWVLAYTLLFLVVPTAFEMALVCVALQSQAGTQFIAIAVTAVVSYIVWTYVVTNWRARFRARYNVLDSRVGGLIVDSLLNYETVKYFCSEKYESERIRVETTKMNREVIRLDQSMAVLNVGQQLIFVVAGVLSLYLATCAVLAAGMTVGDLVLVDALLLQLYLPLSYLGLIYREVQTSTQNIQAMIALLDQPSCVCDAPGATPYVYGNGTIELRDVSFTYHKPAVAAPTTTATTTTTMVDDDSNKADTDAAGKLATTAAAAAAVATRPVLRHLSLTIPGGSTVAFVGPSGSGKSTIFRLLYRFYDPSAGAIYFDGQPLSHLQLSSLRRCVGVIPQDTVLFNETVRYNIRYGRMEASDAEVEDAARKASLHDTVVRMRDGYNTSVGERGLKLSGGEKQRVAIARVLLDDPPILLADEATSALDSTTELNVMHTLKAATRRQGSRRTIILIAHRLTTVREADIIFVLDGKGGLAEQGTHFELLCRGGLYADMWYQQLRERRREEATGAHNKKGNSDNDKGDDDTVSEQEDEAGDATDGSSSSSTSNDAKTTADARTRPSS